MGKWIVTAADAADERQTTELTMKKLGISLALLALVGSGREAVQAGPFTNGGFENNDAWVLDGLGLAIIEQDPLLWTHSGNGRANSLDGGFIYQTFDTVPGAYYDVSFWIRNTANDPWYGVFWDGALVFQETSDAMWPDYELRTKTGLLATGASTTLRFEFERDDAFTEWWLDDVSVVEGLPPAPGVPDAGATLCLLGVGLLGLGWLGRRS